jgi:hypothetical protein
MKHILVKHKVKEFESWKKVFDADAANRKKMGSKGGMLFCSLEDPEMVYILFEVKDIEVAKEFFGSKELKKTMKDAGVVGKPEVTLLDEGMEFKV